MNGSGRAGDGRGGDGPRQISCQEAAERLFEYLDGELGGVEMAEVRQHVEVCQRCYPRFNFERLFLEFVRTRGRRPERSDELRERIRSSLERATND